MAVMVPVFLDRTATGDAVRRHQIRIILSVLPAANSRLSLEKRDPIILSRKDRKAGSHTNSYRSTQKERKREREREF